MADRKGFAPRLVPLGDRAILLELAADLDLAANAVARRVAAEIRRHGTQWIADVVPGLVTVTVHFEAVSVAEAAERRAGLERLLLEAARNARRETGDSPARSVEIPVCYDTALAPDLEEVARRTGLSVGEVATAHAGMPHRVLMIGFAPGHPYLGGLDPRLAVPRRAAPRLRVEAGSVAIANEQTSIYPFATPGGWNIIGRTPLVLFDPIREPATLLEAGDAVTFVPVSRDVFERMAARAPR